MVPKLLLPGTRDFLLAITAVPYNVGLTINHSVSALHTIESLYETLRVLYDANAEGTCPLCPTAEAWESEALAEIRRAIEEAT